MTFENFTIALDDDGIALVVFNVPNRTMNTITVKVLEELPILTARLKEDPAVKAIVLTSGKANGFCAGADLGEMGSNELVGAGAASAEAQLKRKFDSLYLASRAFRGFEACGKPLAAAIEGLALGGGLEWLLGCCYRVVANNPKILLGLPESKLGLLPGGGGTQRLPRILGIEKAFAMISEGRLVGPAEALKLGIMPMAKSARNFLAIIRRRSIS
jgi:3-hydroxyacyl-CoA dehydrogenase/enoyl-CoA hydratase/3-hydroxybutyryl-CoA epimerase